MIRKFRIQNFKSILDHEIELGRFNVLIGANGSGKTNLLEALAMAGGAASRQLGTEELYARGIRISKPSITFSSFKGGHEAGEIVFEYQWEMEKGQEFRITSPKPDDINATWLIKSQLSDATFKALRTLLEERIGLTTLEERIGLTTLEDDIGLNTSWVPFVYDIQSAIAKSSWLESFIIYNLNTPALRGIQAMSRRTPVGINGESLDVLIASFAPETRAKIVEKARVISWLDDLEIDIRDERKFQGHKLGRSTSTLYFRDRFMRSDNNVFSAENANEGVLHILFYLALFSSDKTPPFFGIDNIESALNPALCRELTRHLAELAREHDKQAVIATHNPAILDGLNLHDDEQRLFVVYRDDEGHTLTRRIKVKPDSGPQRFKLSEHWMRGNLGGLPDLF